MFKGQFEFTSSKCVKAASLLYYQEAVIHKSDPHTISLDTDKIFGTVKPNYFTNLEK